MLSLCRSCPPGQVAFPGSYHYCYDEWQSLKKDYDYLPVADAGKVLNPIAPLYASTAPTEAWCQSQCKESCIFYLYNTFKGVPPAGRCSIYTLTKTPVPGMKMGLKVDEGVYMIVDADDKALNIGKEVEVSQVRSVTACSQECDGAEGCVLFVVKPSTGGRVSCSLREGDLDVDYRTKYRVSKATLVAF
jgi:hypothetical protein